MIMKDKKSVIIAVIILVIISAVGISIGVKQYNELEPPVTQQEEAVNQNEETEQKQPEETKPEEKGEEKGEEVNTKTPVFIYFVSESDSNYNEALKVFEELKKEYEGKIEFDLKNVTQNPELLENFALVKDNTPALIMDGKEGITGFQFKMTDKATLKTEIEKALQ